MFKCNSKKSELFLYNAFNKRKHSKSKQKSEILNSVFQSSQKMGEQSKQKVSNDLNRTLFGKKDSFNKQSNCTKISNFKNGRLNKSKEHSLSINVTNTIQSKSKPGLHAKNYSTLPNKKTIAVSRSNSISNLDQTTTMASSNSKRKNQQNVIFNLKQRNLQQKKSFFEYQKQLLHTQEDLKNNLLFGNCNETTLKPGDNPCKTKLNLNLLKKNQNCIRNLKLKIQESIIKRKQFVGELLSEDSVFDCSKNNSNTGTHNNSKDKKMISRNNDSELQTLSLTYSDDDTPQKPKIMKKIDKRPKRNLSNVNKNLFQNSDFLTFCEEMNQKLFNGK